MKKFFKDLNKKLPSYLKVIGIVLASVIVLTIVYSFVEPVYDQLKTRIQSNRGYQSIEMDYGMDYDEEGAYMEKMISSTIVDDGGRSFAPGMSPYIEPIPPRDDVISGDNAEDFEVTEYNATIETRELDETCAQISELKGLDYVIFENKNEYDKGCNYSFKVKNENVDEILEKIESMDPKDFSEYTYTIKRRVDDITNEVDILENKLASINATLEEAIAAYDEITDIATRANDVESLTNIINSKIQIIERLTQEKIYVNERLDWLSKSKGDQLDRLNYTYFHVNVFENKYIDREELKDSWKDSLKDFVRNLNNLAQDITINLLLFFLLALQYGLYLFIILVFAKYGWSLAKYIWKK